MAEFHRLNDAVHDHRRTQTRSESQEEHLSAFVASQRLHGSVIDQLHGPAEGSFKIESGPTASQIVRFRDGNIMEHRSGVTDRYDVKAPVPGDLLNPKDHASGNQRRSGVEFARLGLTADQNLHVTATHID